MIYIKYGLTILMNIYKYIFIRPYHGLFIVSYDLKKKCKTYDNHEGMPYIKNINIIKQLKENEVTYDNINKYYSQLPKFEYWEEFKYSWVDHEIYTR